MKKVLTFLFAFAMISAVAFGQENYSEKVKSFVSELDKAAELTPAQEQTAVEIFTEAVSDLSSKRANVDSEEAGESYMEYNRERWTQAFDELKTHLSEDQAAKVEAFATERGLLKK